MIRSSADTAAAHDAVERAKEAVLKAGDKLTSIWDVTKANGWTQLAEGVDALIAAVRAESQLAWQPIATAPKDRTWILGGREGARNGALTVMFWREEFSGWYSPELNPCEPTHWMPLPAPPQIGSAPDATEAERADDTRRSAAQKSEVQSS